MSHGQPHSAVTPVPLKSAKTNPNPDTTPKTKTFGRDFTGPCKVAFEGLRVRVGAAPFSKASQDCEGSGKP
jgi:hypothetical protein